MLIAAGAATLGYLATTGHGLDLTYHNGIFRGAAAFGIGVGLAMLHREVKPHADALPDYAFSLAQILVLGALWWAIYRTGWSHRPQDIYTALAEMMLVAALAFDRGFLAAFFKLRVPQLFGEMSYAIYMGQTAVLQMLRQAQMHWYPAPGDMVLGRSWAAWDPLWHWLEPALVLAVAIAWGWLIFRFVEKPASAVLKRWIAGREKQIVASAK